MQLLRKKGTLEPTWPYHPMLALRPDMEIVPGSGVEVSTTVANDADIPVADGALDVYAITDKDQLRAILRDRNVKVVGNPSLKSLQDRLAGVVGESDACQ